MADDFQSGICSSTWWSSPRGSIGFSPCLVSINDFGNFGWPSDLGEVKARSSATRSDVNDSNISNHESLFFPDMQKPGEVVLMDSNLQMMDIGLSSSTTTATTSDWNQNFISGSENHANTYQSSMVQDSGILNSLNNPIQEKEYCGMKNFSLGGGQSSTVNEKKQTSSTREFPLDSSLTMSSSSYSYPSTLIDTLFGEDQDQLPLENQTMNIQPTINYRTNLNEFSHSLAKLPSLLSSSLSKQQAYVSPLHLTNKTPYWNNGSAAAPSDISGSTFPSTQEQFLEKPNFSNLKQKSNNGVTQDSKKSNGEPAFKRPRIETPSPLPTFKVRKEKLGDRITALQQLVSPFGKTDTASVLQEAIEYIKFLHDQVNVLGTPYMKNGAPVQKQNYENTKDPERQKQDLRSRGLCLVPISSTFPVANETTADFWTPTFGGTFR